MSLGTDILQAVKSGGISNWRPMCEKNAQGKVKHQRAKDFNLLLEQLLQTLGTGQFTASQLAEKLGWGEELVRHRMANLIAAKKVRKSTGRKPYLYFKA